MDQFETAWEQILMALSLLLIFKEFYYLLRIVSFLLLELLVLAHSKFVPMLDSVLIRHWHLLDLTCFCSVLLTNNMWCDSSPASLDFISCLLVLTTCLKLTFLEALDLLNWDPRCISTTTGCRVFSFSIAAPLAIRAQQTQPGSLGLSEHFFPKAAAVHSVVFLMHSTL